MVHNHIATHTDYECTLMCNTCDLLMIRNKTARMHVDCAKKTKNWLCLRTVPNLCRIYPVSWGFIDIYVIEASQVVIDVPIDKDGTVSSWGLLGLSYPYVVAVPRSIKPTRASIYTNETFLFDLFKFGLKKKDGFEPTISPDNAVAFGDNTGVSDLVGQLQTICARLRTGELTTYVTCFDCWHSMARTAQCITQHLRQGHATKILVHDFHIYECLDHEWFFLTVKDLEAHLREH